MPPPLQVVGESLPAVELGGGWVFPYFFIAIVHGISYSPSCTLLHSLTLTVFMPVFALVLLLYFPGNAGYSPGIAQVSPW